MRKLIYFTIVVGLFVSSCKDKNTKSYLPNVTGKSGEVILVIDPDHWAADAGSAFKKKLSQTYPALPQKEPVFDLVHIPYDAFSSIFKTHRNVIFAKVDKDMHEPKMIVQKDVWAKPQLVINVIAPDEKSLAALVDDKGDVMVDRIMKKERERYIASYKKYEEIGIADALENKFGIRLTVPKGYSLDLDTTDFVWIESRGRGDAVQGILVYSYEKPDVELTTPYLFAKRTQFTERFVPGPTRGSYMAVERDFTPYRREIKVNDLDVIELRGLWKVENDFMGGPFISLTVVDKEKNRVITADGFVYAPQFDKRDYIRQLEAILNTIQMPSNESAD